MALEGLRALSLAVNVPGPAAAARLRHHGLAVVKVEPPGGDPLARFCPAWYAALAAGQEVVTLDLKAAGDRACLDDLLAATDLLLTSSRPGALARLGLGPDDLPARHPRLCHVAIVGYPAPDGERPGHDLTYLAEVGLAAPPALPRTLLADLAGAERAAAAGLALLLARERGGPAGRAEVALADVAADFAASWRHGLTGSGGILGGGFPGYGLYRAGDGWVAVAALEPHFWARLQRELGVPDATHDDLRRAFLTADARHWERWAAARDLPLVAVRAADEDAGGRG
jgi:crotonobetainyl-CoA:carnitine CoA-transferase CaiB-like acyl-CoA transferase